MGTDFADATAVVPTSEGTWAGQIAEGWDIVGNANGGYLLAIVARAIAAAADRPDPVTITGHYLSPGKPGSAVVTTEVVKSGRRFTTARATLVAGDRPVLTALGTFGDLAPSGDDPELIRGAPPALPPPEDCVLIRSASPFPPPFMDRVELRLHPDDANFRDGQPNARLPIAWTPTVELTAHVRARPVPGWLACSFSTRFVTSGFLEADGEVWDGTGRLVAQSRQLALVPRPV
jgi:acyl-CoA thioesterase